MDQNWVKIVKWHDGIGRRAFNVHSLQNLEMTFRSITCDIPDADKGCQCRCSERTLAPPWRECTSPEATETYQPSHRKKTLAPPRQKNAGPITVQRTPVLLQWICPPSISSVLLMRLCLLWIPKAACIATTLVAPYVAVILSPPASAAAPLCMEEIYMTVQRIMYNVSLWSNTLLFSSCWIFSLIPGRFFPKRASFRHQLNTRHVELQIHIWLVHSSLITNLVGLLIDTDRFEDQCIWVPVNSSRYRRYLASLNRLDASWCSVEPSRCNFN